MIQTVKYSEALRVMKGQRLKMNMTQAAVAKKVGVARRTVISWEQDEKEPSVTMFDKWCDAIGFKLVVDLKN